MRESPSPDLAWPSILVVDDTTANLHMLADMLKRRGFRARPVPSGRLALQAVRATFDPEYLYYTLGRLEILKLRDDYHKQEGASFSLQKFHDELLRHGMPPIRLLRELMLKDRATWDAVL